MKVSLISIKADPIFGTHPRERIPPIVLLYAATLLKSFGFEVRLFDFDWRGLRRWPTPALEPSDFFVVEADIVSSKAAEYLARYIKKNFDKLIALYSLSQEDDILSFLKSSFDFDYAICGDPEKPILELARHVAGEGDLSEYIWTRKSSDFKNLKPYFEKDLDSLPFPDQSLLPNLRYSKRKFSQPKKNGPWRFLLSNRGCPYSCLFCSSAHRNSFGSLFRAHSPEYILNLIEYYKEHFGLGAVSFEDDIFTLDRESVIAFCDGIKKRNLTFPWVIQTRVDRLDGQLLKAMRSSGCYGIAFGITSLDDEFLAFVKKGFNGAQALEGLKLCYENGFSVLVNMVVGLPGQSPEHFRCSIKKLIANMPKGYIHVHKFDPRGCRDKGDWLSKPAMTSEQADRLQVWAYRKFYFRPKNLLYQFTSRIRSIIFDSGERKLFFDFLKYSLVPRTSKNINRVG